MLHYTTYESPMGRIIISAENNAIVRLAFGDLPPDSVSDANYSVLSQCRSWLDDYFLGKKPNPKHLPLTLTGSPFQRSVWTHLQAIPYGQTMTYGELAKKLGSNMSARAIGGAVSRNPISIIVPCHRVLGTGGRLTGYAFGLDRKKALLDLEKISYRK